MSILDSVKKINSAVKNSFYNKKTEEKNKDKTKGSQYIETSDKIVEDVVFAYNNGFVLDNGNTINLRNPAGEIDLELLRANVRNADRKKLTIEQVKDILLIAENQITYEKNPGQYTISEDGRTLTPVE